MRSKFPFVKAPRPRRDPCASLTAAVIGFGEIGCATGVVSTSNGSSGVQPRAVHNAIRVDSLTWLGCLVNNADTDAEDSSNPAFSPSSRCSCAPVQTSRCPGDHPNLRNTTCCATAFATPRKTGPRSPRTSNWSTPRPASPPRWTRSSRSARPGRAVPAIIKLWENAWDRLRPVPGLRQGNPQRDLHDEQHRKPELQDPQGGERPRPLPISYVESGWEHLAPR
jgi:hypothetical protein